MVNPTWQLSKRAALYFFLFLLGLVSIAILVLSKNLTTFDETVIRVVQGWEQPALTSLMIFFSNMGAGMPAVIVGALIMLILYKFFHHRKELIYFLFVVVLSGLINRLLKLAFRLDRPDIHRLVQQSGYGFPSGHAMGAATLYGVTAFLLWKHLQGRNCRMLAVGIAGFMILAIGISRIYLGVHYPSDVLGGYLAGGCWLTASIWLYLRFEESRQLRSGLGK